MSEDFEWSTSSRSTPSVFDPELRTNCRYPCEIWYHVHDHELGAAAPEDNVPGEFL